MIHRGFLVQTWLCLFLVVNAAAAANPNLVRNPGFAVDLSHWTWDPRYVQGGGADEWSPLDASGEPGSGSLKLTVSVVRRARQLLQCISTEPGRIYEFGAKAYYPPEHVGGFAMLAYVEYETPNCTGAYKGFGELAMPLSQETGIWHSLSAIPPISPSAGSFQAILGLARSTPGTSSAHFDDVFVRLVPPRVVIPSFPDTLSQTPQDSSAQTTFAITNVGDLPTDLVLEQQGTFFSVFPSAIHLEARGTAYVTVVAAASAEGFYSGAVLPRGEGVPEGYTIPIRLASAGAPIHGSIVASETRIDVSAAPEVSTIESFVDLRNHGTAAAQVALGSAQAWIVVPTQLISIPPGELRRIPFSIDRTRRFDAQDPAGSVTGALSIGHHGGLLSKISPDNGTGVSRTLVTVKDSAAQKVAGGEIPRLLPGQIAYFLAGVGHVQGSVGTFVSDLSVAASKLVGLAPDLEFFYVSMGNDPSASILRLDRRMRPNQFVSYADVIRSYFNREGETGTLQLRVGLPDVLTVNANVFNKSNPAGTYGTSIPLFRSDRGVPSRGSLYMTGLLGSSSAAHTNLVLQETAGGTVHVDVQFLQSDGATVATASTSIAPYRAVRMDNVVPPGAVAAILTSRFESDGAFLAYATPVDKALESDGSRKGGDTWSVTDWPRIFGYDPGAPVIIPVAGVVRGANNTLFRTDVALMNVGEVEAVGDLTFRAPNFAPVTREVRLRPRESAIYPNVLQSEFGIESAPVGYLTLVPRSGRFALTSRIFATVGDQVATFGTGVPALSLQSALRRGQKTRISGFDDAGLDSIDHKRPGTFRTNLGLVETDGEEVTVRVTLHNFVPEGTTALSAFAWRDIKLAPNQSLLLPRISQQILGSGRDALAGDLTDLFADIEVIEGNGGAIAFISSVDNGSADQILQTPY